MFKRPAFLDRFLSGIPDPLSLRFQAVVWTALVAGSFGLLLVLAAVQLDERRSTEVARARAETLAETAGIWLDGDAHSGLGADPEKRLADLTSSLKHLLDQSGYDGSVRTLRPKAEAKTALSAQPGTPRAGALEVVLQTGGGKVRENVDYRPEMAPALFEGKCTSALSAGEILAFAPVPDSWGSTPAIVCVRGPATAPLWRQIVFLVAASLFAGLLVSGAVWCARVHARRLADELALLTAGAQELASGRLPGPIVLRARATRELAAIAAPLEGLRLRLEAQANGRPLPIAPPVQAEEERPRTQLGEASEFDLALLLQQLVEPARKVALSRRLEFQLVFPDGVPSRLNGHPMVLYKALDGLLRNALRVTDLGKVTLRVSRAGEGPDGWRLRFEVSDTGPGIAFKEQQELAASLSAAALEDASTLKDPLRQASALARALGGELSFESQPGQGSRFGFCAAFHPSVPLAATGFQSRPATAFQPRGLAGSQPNPVTAFQTRPKIGAR